MNGLPDIDWVTIPDGGEFIFGDVAEKNGPLKLRLREYKISRYPITNVQFQAFVDAADGFADTRWWTGLAVPVAHQGKAGEQFFKFANHPRDNVSLFDAIAFCRWLSVKERKVVRLPTEQEWEKAARGHNGRIYPWGNDFISDNTNTKGMDGEPILQTTSTVGMYSQGVSTYGLSDMSGNVWEWCWNGYAGRERNQISRENDHVLRGGTWNSPPKNARCIYRRRNPPNTRDYFTGFRVVVEDP